MELHALTYDPQTLACSDLCRSEFSSKLPFSTYRAFADGHG